MSIFPKKVTKDESVIIHVRIKNDDDLIKFMQLRTYIKSPKGTIVKRFNKDLVVNINSKNGEYKDYYFEYKPDENSELGRYHAYTDLYYKGEVLHSLTINDDYFDIEQLDITNTSLNDKTSFTIVNKSNENTDFKLISFKSKNKTTIECTVDGLGSKSFDLDADQVFIQYANNYCEKIFEEDDIVYIRNKDFGWKQEGEELVVFNSNESIDLDNAIAYIWLSCDGLNSIREISIDTGIPKDDILKVLNELEASKLVYRIR